MLNLRPWKKWGIFGEIPENLSSRAEKGIYHLAEVLV